MSPSAPAPTAGPRPPDPRQVDPGLVDPRLAPVLIRSVLDRDPDPSSLAVLLSIEPESLGGDVRVELIEAVERLKGMVDGLQQRALSAVVDATEEVGLDGDLARHEVGAALRLAPPTAAHRTRVAHDLLHLRTATQRALEVGRITYQQAAHLVDALRDLDDELAASVEARVLAKAHAQTLAEMKRATARAILSADPTAALRRHQKAAAGRTIERNPMPDAMEGWWVALPADVADTTWSALSRRASLDQAARRSTGADDPGMDALRVDALVAAILSAPAPSACEAAPAATATAAAAGTPAGTSASRSGGSTTSPRELPRCRCGGAQTVAVVLDLPTALGLADNPAELPRYGPIPGPLARRMAVERDWVRWTTDPGTRQVVDRGADTYRPSEAMRALIAARDGTCGFPGCSRRAQDCDCDHVLTFHGENGRTVTINLGPLCRQHHNAKTHGRWRLRYDPETGVRTWTSPLGRRYATGTDPPLA